MFSCCKRFHTHVILVNMKRHTIKDVARMAGVSPATVSRVFAPGSSVSPAVDGKVRAAADELGYRPSVMARSLARSRTDLVALVVGRLNNPFDARLVEELSGRLDARGKRLLVVPADYGENDPASLVALDYQVDGIIVAAGHLSEASAERFVQLGVPVILYGREMHAAGVDCVVADNVSGARQVGALFRRSGVGNAIYLRHARRTFSDDERGLGFREGLGLGAKVSELQSSSADSRNAAMAALSGHPSVQGVFCANDLLAFGVVEAAVRLGLVVPDQLRIAGFDDIDMAASPFYDLTSVRQPPEEIASWVVERLLERMESPGLAVITHRLPASLVPRRTAPASSGFGGLAAGDPGNGA